MIISTSTIARSHLRQFNFIHLKQQTLALDLCRRYKYLVVQQRSPTMNMKRSPDYIFELNIPQFQNHPQRYEKLDSD